jgi:2-polyprenyl-3-methyl-5-hydroxy-6-metoxy-1,4-benzoquinol methylase
VLELFRVIEPYQKKSFRDPSGFIIESNRQIFRGIHKHKESFYKYLFSSDWYKNFVSDNKVQSSSWYRFDDLDDQYVWINHQKFNFPLFPHEISAEQLYKSALLTIEIAKKALDNNFILKDASAWNVVFDEGRPIFCDVTSFEAYCGSSLWAAYGQFCRHFIIPLLLHKYLKMSPAKLFLTSRDGVKPKDAKYLLRWSAITSLAAFETVLLPSLASDSGKSDGGLLKTNKDNTELNKTILLNTFNRLEKYIRTLRPSKITHKSTWSEYESDRHHYSTEDLEAKFVFVKESLKLCNGPVLDLGCNQGQYSQLASSLGLKVVATDFDEKSLIKLEAKSNNTNISVSLLNICQPTPSIGWDNREHIGFLEKAKNHFEIVLCLGLIHHMLVTERIPLNFIIDTLASCTNKFLLIEWVDPDDEKFKEISSYEEDLYSFLSSTYFESLITTKFRIINKLKLQQAKRSLYLLEKIAG